MEWVSAQRERQEPENRSRHLAHFDFTVREIDTGPEIVRLQRHSDCHYQTDCEGKEIMNVLLLML